MSRPEVVSAHSALVFPNFSLCLLHALCKRRAVTRIKMEDPTPPNPTLSEMAKPWDCYNNTAMAVCGNIQVSGQLHFEHVPCSDHH